MKTIEIKLYKFNELSEQAQKIAIEKEQKYQYENSDLLFMFNEDIVEQAKKKGFVNPKFQYSLNNCQGDGLSFSFEKYEHLKDLFIKHLGKGKEKTAQLLEDNCTLKASGNNGHYCYASKSDVDLYLENYTSAINTNCENINSVVSLVLSELENIYIDFCKQLEKKGYAEIDYLTSCNTCKENLIANYYDFTEDGSIY